MNKGFNKETIVLSLVAIVLVTGIVIYSRLVSLDPYSWDHRNPCYPSSYSDWTEYQIDPETILTSLDQKDTNVFTPMLVTPSSDAQFPPRNTFLWTQSDYLKIANALSQHEWNEPLDLKNWSVYYLAFGGECQGNTSGYNHMEITYYKTIKGIVGKTYQARHIEIYPFASEVGIGDSSSFDRRYFVGNNPIDLTKFKISADDALRIAEENGEKDVRLKYQDGCSISIRMPIHNYDDSWEVDYFDLKMAVNPYTGKFRIINTNK
ncbi:MAG: hypothetical protein JW730_13065 [Anaerolineales bacterium]|nr:hypothetical protein [Anaerolineales bacterium]